MSARSVNPHIPDGYQVVQDGVIQAEDLVWNDSACQWDSATVQMVKDDVDAYHCVVRRVPSAKKAA